MLTLVLFLLFFAGIEIYSFIGFKSLIPLNAKTFSLIYWGTTMITIAGIFLVMKAFRGSYHNIPLHVNIIFGMAFSFIVAKLFASTIFLVEDIFRSFAWLFQSVVKFRLAEWTSRTFLAGITAATLAGLVIILANYGVWFGRYQFKTHRITLEYDNLPAEFDGFKIAQISDLHLGTFDQKSRVRKGLQKLQQENPDLILFTGDMVNNRADEALAFVDILKELHAPYGKFSVLGNHDYGDYSEWESADAKKANLDKLKGIHADMGFRLLLNENITLKKGTDSIYIAGVENWGVPPFPQYGDLQKAIQGITANDFTVLLSHDPTHWKQQIIADPKKIELTLSGHTHGFQFGFEIGKFKWSPVKYRYPDWSDLFEQNGRKLYINRGFGSLGFPGRIGILPEITIIELKAKS